MSWPKGKPRPQGAGRVAGTPNKKTLDALDKAKAANFDPLDFLMKVAKNDYPGLGYDVPLIHLDQRIAAAKELAQYLYPKRKALEIDSTVNIDLAKKAEEFSQLPKEEQIRLAEQELMRLKGST